MKPNFFGLIGLCLVVLSSAASAFPTGIYECGTGQVTSRVEIEKVSAGSVSLPHLSVTLRQPDLESALSGLGLLQTVTDKKTGAIERRIKLPGSNFDLRYDENDELQFSMNLVGGSKICKRKS